MKILFCGLGSIGQRHFRNLCDIGGEQGVTLSVDAIRATSRELPPDIAARLDRQYPSIAASDTHYDIAFVTNPTASHEETLAALSGRATHFFIEKPVFSRRGVSITALQLGNGVRHVACPLRWNPVVRQLKELATTQPVFAARAICSSYLPDWRPGADYRACYSANRAAGGGVTLDLIHEWDYLTDLFGFPQAVHGFAGRFSPLEIDSDDLAVYIARYPALLLTLSLDYIGRVPARNIELYTEDDIIFGDILNQTVTYRKSGAVETLPKADVHRDELSAFMNGILAGDLADNNPIEHAAAVLELALTAQEAP